LYLDATLDVVTIVKTFYGDGRSVGLGLQSMGF
jgi:hypothetical protein